MARMFCGVERAAHGFDSRAGHSNCVAMRNATEEAETTSTVKAELGC